MRLGLLSYINSLPLTYGLESGAVAVPGGQVLTAEPSRLNALALAGELDVTAVSSVEYVRLQRGYALLEPFCLKSLGPVQSVRLYSLIPLEELAGASIGVTSASATSRALLQVLQPEVRLFTLHEEPVLSAEMPAALLIGDRALRELSGARFVYDLGEEWHRQTGLPMVWALYLVRRGFPEVEKATRAFRASREWGLEHRQQVLRVASERTGLGSERLEAYFAVLDYELDQASRQGLAEFHRRCQALGLFERATV